MSEIPYFVLVQHGEPGDGWTFQFFATAEERRKATQEAIFGDLKTLSAAHQREFDAQCDVLAEEGELRFEGDPGLEWRTGWAQTPELAVVYASNAKLTARISDLSEKLRRAHSKKRLEVATAAMQGLLADCGGHGQAPILMRSIPAAAVQYADNLLLALSESKEGE